MRRIRASMPAILRGACLVALIAPTIYLLDRQLVSKLHPDATTLGFAVIVVLLALVLIFPREVERFVERVSSFKVAGLEVGLTQAERATVVDRIPRYDEFGTTPVPPRTRTGTVVGDLFEIRLCLVERLRWLATELALHNTEPADVLDEVAMRRLLDPEQHQFATDLLLPARSDLPSLPSSVQEPYLDRAWRFANRLRPTVCDRAVRRDLWLGGWFLADFKQSPKHRPDFVATKDGLWLLMAPRVALDANSATDQDEGQLAKTMNRWARDANRRVVRAVPLTSWVIVIPNVTKALERLPTLAHDEFDVAALAAGLGVDMGTRVDPYVVKRARIASPSRV